MSKLQKGKVKEWKGWWIFVFLMPVLFVLSVWWLHPGIFQTLRWHLVRPDVQQELQEVRYQDREVREVKDEDREIQETRYEDREILVHGLREAMFWKAMENNKVLCELCFHRCVIPAARRGACRVRENIAGTLYSLVHSRPSAVMIDPIEKEPQLHHRPGTFILCVGTVGCNFHCKHCQNWTLSQASPTDRRVFDAPPYRLVELALEYGVTAISFTYNDPIVLFEYAYDTARLAHAAGVGLILHTNAAISEAPLRHILPYVTAFTVDLKGFCEEVYWEYFGGDLSYVLRSLKIIREEGVWLEIVNLIIPTINDCMDEIRAMSEWILEHLGPDVPLHFSRFHPAFKMKHLPATPVSTLEEAHSIAREVGINFVTIGNVAGHRYNSTFCPCTGERLIHRVHFTVIYNRIVDGKSPFSGRPVPGIWE